MSEHDSFAERRRGLETEYFRKKERELIEKLRLRAQKEEERKAMAEVTSIADEDVLSALQDLGYTRETVRLLHLVPLVQVGWMSGSVTPDEREMILDAARLSGIAKDSEAYRTLNAWFDRSPSEEFFDQTLTVIRYFLSTLPKEESEKRRESLLNFCLGVAEASGGILGLGRKVSADERKALEKIAAALQRSGQSVVSKVITE